MCKTTWIAAAAAFAGTSSLSASVAWADVTLEHRIAVSGTGIMSAGNLSGMTKTVISGQHSRTDSDIQLQSRVVRLLAHRAVGPTAEIVRLDRGTIDRLDLNRKQYTEVTFDQVRERLQKALDHNPDAGSPGGEQKPLDDSKCEWLEPKADVRRTGEKATYAGFEAERLTIVASQPCKDRETGAVCEVALSLDEWLTPKLAASAEADQFHRAYAQKMGLDASGHGAGGDITQRAQSMFGRYQGIWGEIVGKTRDVKGYPVKSSFAFAFGGPQCRSTATQQSQQPAADSGSGSLAGRLGTKVAGSLFHKKDDSQQSTSDSNTGAAAAAPTLPDGLVPLITMSSELVSVSTDGVSAALFDIPPDFKKVQQDKP
ncbi:MAG TPA: hypothetical protein VHB68_10760 [Steroidobacteraceae bacterium]|nr:hypothetical protein [Steroidobacteraceae bacterium]